MLKKSFSILLDILIIIFQPYVEMVGFIIEPFINKNKIKNPKLILVIKDFKSRAIKRQKVQITLYYVFFVLIQFLMLLSLSSGKIIYVELGTLLIITLLYLLFAVAFGVIVLSNLKNDRIKFLTYIQILLCFPIVVAYWIVSLEGKDLLLNEFNRTDWISLFGIIVTYFSASFIGVIIGYNNFAKTIKKTEKVSK